MYFVYGTIPVSVKRYHDLNKSGWKYLIWSCLIPVVPITIGLITAITAIIFDEWNQLFSYGVVGVLIGFIYSIAYFIYLCLKRGTSEKNEYSDPL